MTTKTVAVQLVALTSQYQKSMSTATASTAKLQASSGAASKSIGSVLGPTAVIAGAAVVGASVKMALGWEESFSKIASITDTSQGQVEQWKSQVLALAGETAQAPQDLADALYFLASAGLDASQIMPTLEASAKAAAVGLGDAADIARLTANTLNAYSDSGMTAAQVTDTLVAAVRVGTAEPDEFADAMGRILPIAAKAGISFDQVAASLAGLSNIGLDVNEGVTAMRGVMVALLAPGKQAADTLAEVGLSADDVRRSLAEDGLIATLRLLETRTKGNIDLLRKIVPNVRAMAGAFGLTGQEAKKVDAIFRDVLNSSGDLGDSFKKRATSEGFKLKQALTELNIVMIQLGEDVLPLVVDSLGALASVAGPLVDLGHKLAEAWSWLQVPIPKFRTSDITQREVDLIMAGATAEEAHATALRESGEAGELAAGQATYYARTIRDSAGAGEGAAPKLGKFAGAVKDSADAMKDAEEKGDKFTTMLMGLAGIALDAEDAALGWNQALADMVKELKKGDETLDITSQAGRDNREAFKSAAEAAIEHGEAVAQQTGSVEKGTEVVADHITQLRNEAIQAGFTEEEIDAYIRKLNLTPKDIRTLIKLENDKAQADLEKYFQDLFRLNGMSVTTYVNQVVTTEDREVGHSGGIVGSLPRFHRGGIAGDERLIVARKGEHILTPSQYASLRAAPSGTVVEGATPMSQGPTIINLYVGREKVDRLVLDSVNRSLSNALRS